MNNSKSINILDIDIDYSWSFSDKTLKDTSYITHGYYTYPAKFIPQLVERLINDFSNEGDTILDPFMGSGTTIVESIINKRRAIGADINDLACLIAKVKTTPINNGDLLTELYNMNIDLSERLNGQYDTAVKEALMNIPQNERIDYWFLPIQKEKLAILLKRINEIENHDIRDFFIVAFAQVLKPCSIWMSKSIKPTREPNKKVYNPIELFLAQTQKMIQKHYEFDCKLDNNIKQNIQNFRKVYCTDSRCLPCENEEIDMVITSPPYVTSYEYADLHQLPLLWLGIMDELSNYRKKFIGSSFKESNDVDIKSNTALKIISSLKNKKQQEVRNYFSDMQETFEETKRVLKKNGKACIVIGDTEFRGVKILNAEVFKEQLENIGFKTHSIIKREIPSKMLPSTRNPENGRFTKVSDESIKMAYPTEYILIMEKS